MCLHQPKHFTASFCFQMIYIYIYMYIHIWYCFFLFVGINEQSKFCSYVSQTIINTCMHAACMHACIHTTYVHPYTLRTDTNIRIQIHICIYKYIYIYNCLYTFIFMHANKFTLNFVRITIGARCAQKTGRSQAQTPHEKIQLEMSSEPKHPKKTRTMQLIWGCEVLATLVCPSYEKIWWTYFWRSDVVLRMALWVLTVLRYYVLQTSHFRSASSASNKWLCTPQQACSNHLFQIAGVF